MTEWLDVAKGAAEGVGLAVPIIGVLKLFHSSATKYRARQEKAIAEIMENFNGVTEDVAGLRAQFAATEVEIERRYMPREDVMRDIRELRAGLTELNRNIGALNGHLLDLARDHARS